MEKLLVLCGGKRENIFLGVGDLYVTVFGGRTRKIGTLLGEGKHFDEALEILKGVTLESIVIARRTADAVLELEKTGRVKKGEFPLLAHIRELLADDATVNVPWQKFETETIL